MPIYQRMTTKVQKATHATFCRPLTETEIKWSLLDFTYISCLIVPGRCLFLTKNKIGTIYIWFVSLKISCNPYTMKSSIRYVEITEKELIKV